jgi:hypothetical protein
VTCGVSIPSFVVASASAIAALLVSPAPASAGDYDIDFVTAFAEACVPQRMSYPGTVDTARAAGWREVERTAHPELDALMAKSEEAASDPELKPTFAYTLLAKAIAGIDHHLVVSRSSFVLDPDENPPDPWVLIGCYLYNLDATAPVDPAPVTALIGNPIANSHADDTLTAHVWGPPCPMPRTGDTYLTYIPDGSPHADAGFTGVVLKFETSEPDPGEAVPETYCR